jgi:hypothetical protein
MFRADSRITGVQEDDVPRLRYPNGRRDRSGVKVPNSYIVLTDCVVEITASTWGGFCAGRTITYFAAGLVENTVPSYNSEVSPAPLRGFFTGSLITFLLIGNLLGAALCQAFVKNTTNVSGIWFIRG